MSPKVETTRDEVERYRRYVLRIEEQFERLAAERAEYLRRCEPIKEEINTIYRTARDEGLRAHWIKDIVERRQVEREILEDLARAEDPEAAFRDYFRYKAEAEEADRRARSSQKPSQS